MNLQDLALKAAAARDWRWLAGALARGEDPTTGDPGWLRVREFHNRLTLGGQAHQLTRPYPDLNDPATVGCLHHLVLEAWGCGPGAQFIVTVDIAPRMEGAAGWFRIADHRGRKVPGAFGKFIVPSGLPIRAFALVEALGAAPPPAEVKP